VNIKKYSTKYLNPFCNFLNFIENLRIVLRERGEYCYVCGSDKILWWEGGVAYYDKNGKFVEFESNLLANKGYVCDECGEEW